MEISIEDFMRLSDEKAKHLLQIAELQRQVACLQTENQMLKDRVGFLETSNAAAQVANFVLSNCIMLSVERIKAFVLRLNGIEKFSFIKTFLEYGLAQEHRREQLDVLDQVMVLPDEPKKMGETHNHFAAGSNNQVFNGEASGQFGPM